jgi:hypothetical protein
LFVVLFIHSHLNSQGIQVEPLSAYEACCPRALIAKSIRPIFSTSHSPPDRDIGCSETVIAILHSTYEYRMLAPLPPTHPSSLCPAYLFRIEIYWDPPCCSRGIIHMALRWWAHIRWTECTVRHCPPLDSAAWKHLSNLHTFLTLDIQGQCYPSDWGNIEFGPFLNITTIPFTVDLEGGRHYHTHTPLRIPLAKNV